MDAEEKRYYSLLGVTKQATDEELKKAYRAAAKKYHPDRNPGHDVTKFKEVTEAYNALLEIRSKKGDKFSIKNIFGSVNNPKPPKSTVYAGAVKESKSQPKPKPKRGEDIYADVTITFEESLVGCMKRIKLTRKKYCNCCYNGIPDSMCSVCGGTGYLLKSTTLELKLPQNIVDGQSIKIAGKGNVGEFGGEPGDIIIDVQVEKSGQFINKGLDIYYKLNITFPEAVLGARKTVPTVYGTADLTIPPGTQSGSKICLKGKGVLNTETGEMGDEYVVLRILVPKVRSENERKLMKMVERMMYDSVIGS
ncbi:MAG: DnaJ C-terminal domain-containing protein [bacterium]|nr:DnaJ C-terminal domain-containing protein [bacterium]